MYAIRSYYELVQQQHIRPHPLQYLGAMGELEDRHALQLGQQLTSPGREKLRLKLANRSVRELMDRGRRRGYCRAKPRASSRLNRRLPMAVRLSCRLSVPGSRLC